MKLLSRGEATHSQRLERYLGSAQVALISGAMRRFYHPIPVAGVPGRVFAMPGGDFAGRIDGGQEMSAYDRALDIVARGHRAFRIAGVHARHRSYGQLNAFASFNAIIAALTGGKGQRAQFQKVGQTAIAVGNCIDLWSVGNQPAAGSAGAAAPGGTATTNASQGALKFTNPVNSNTAHHLGMNLTASVAGNGLLLIDQLLRVAKTMNSTATEAVTGTFSRYQSATGTNADYIGGNFVFPSVVGTTLANTAHNWTVCQYTDEAGNTANSIPSIAGLASATSSIRHIDLTAGNWFMPLAAGDVGVKALTQMQCSALVATGVLDFVVAHPIAFYVCPVANLVSIFDGLFTALNLQQIYDNACLSLIELPKPATTATTYSGELAMVAE